MSPFDLEAYKIIKNIPEEASKCAIKFINDLSSYCLQAPKVDIKAWTVGQPNLELIAKFNRVYGKNPANYSFSQVVTFFVRTSNIFRNQQGIALKSNYADILSIAIPVEDITLAHYADRAKDRLEVHHLVPRNVGGPDCFSNGIALTTSEHVCAHLAENLQRVGDKKGTVTSNSLAATGPASNHRGQNNPTRIDKIKNMSVL